MNRHIKLGLFAVTLALCAIGGAPLAVADAITAPNNFYIGNAFPFGGVGDGSYQQVYSSSFFSGRIKITGLSFFIAEYTSPTNDGFVSGSYIVSLSTTSVAVGALDPNNMAGNLGADDKVVFKGSLDGGASIDLKPFIYDPSMGNLLLTVEVTGRVNDEPAEGNFWRAANDTGTSRAWNFPDWANPALGADNVGLVTTFTFKPFKSAPEPTTLALLGIGLAGLGFARRKQ